MDAPASKRDESHSFCRSPRQEYFLQDDIRAASALKLLNAIWNE